MAGEMLGLRAIYIDAGSGAEKEISARMIATVRKSITVPLMVGGGINTGGGYSDIDLMFTADDRFVHKDGTPYPETKRPA